jgi:3-oxoadipate enol-lactonase
MSPSLLRLPALSRRLGFPQVAPVRRLPPCRTIDLPRRDKTYAADSGPVTDSPTFLLLHSVACTGLMTWYPALEMMRGYGRVIVFDQRWHGHGIHSPGFALEACADDVAALADALGVRRFVAVGYSMGSLVAHSFGIVTANSSMGCCCVPVRQHSRVRDTSRWP